MRVPADFNLRSTIRSHGWSVIGPFDCNPSGQSLTIRLPGGAATIRQEKRRLVVEGTTDLAAVRDCLRLDLDLSGFWRLTRTDPELAWVSRRRAGRMLRAPTAFADAAMVLATTNCSWALTTRMLAHLIARWGRRGAFPSQRVIGQASEADLRAAGWGYRAPYLRDLARGPDLAPLRDDDRPTAELRRHLLGLPGFGPYAADTMLKQLGRFEHLALDSWVTRVWKERFPRRKATESAIRRRLAAYGPYVGLAFFLIVTATNYSAATWKV